MEVKKITKENYNLAQKLFCESFNKKANPVSLPLLGDLIGLYLNEELIGLCQIDYINNILENKRQAIINNFCIKKEQQNKGYGNYLLNNCITYLQSKNINELIVRSNKKRISAHILYKKNNFQEIDTTILIKNLN